jgi:hypothetical protein
MVTVRVTANTFEYRGEGFVEGDRLAVPDDLAEEMVRGGVVVRAQPEQAAKRRERATKAQRETR